MSTASDSEPPADAGISQDKGLAYWSSISPDDAGVLGGYPHVSRADLRGSATFYAKLRRKFPTPGNTSTPTRNGKVARAVDCGAGIGRVTKGFLVNVARVVDIVEPVKALTDVITTGDEWASLRSSGSVGDIFNAGLEAWSPPPGRTYELVWIQWCLGQLTDTQVVGYLERVKGFTVEGGWVVVKENLSTDEQGRDVFDEVDSSVTRTDAKWRSLFERAEYRVCMAEVQRGLPRELYPVKAYALRPVGWA
ncbi:hypothetical protein EJ06DRAFT_514818 [Trichodelitschia bisporula]|uniref:Alpha N-terminal protein methyltransferase 1 n=1 Tax=Trichodelitschia bisporula TaxID=703511 RepID=A0A6G1HNU2_9PEZI|nr:hypothetical protein EJ06DRAFT_514818 [Trichodelitschia bisporula]